MAVDHVKSPSVTNLDASPIIANVSGEGAAGLVKCITGWSTAVLNSSTDATYQFCRVPSNCKVKQITFESGAQAAGTLDVGLYYATDGQGGRPVALLAAAAIDQDFFASLVAVTSLSQPTNVTNESGTYTIDKQNMPLWQAVGLTADPGGSFDIVGTVVTAVTTAAAKWGMSVYYCD